LYGSDSRAVKMRALKSAEHAATRSCVASSPARVTSSWCSLSTCTACIAVVRHPLDALFVAVNMHADLHEVLP
jgi:hypothetical protein